MNRLNKILAIRRQLRSSRVSLGSWMQLSDGSVAEIMGRAGYDWVAVDLEHGSIGRHQLPDLFRALELGDTLPLARLSQGAAPECKFALDAGAGGVIVPMVETAADVERAVQACRWPPAGTRGVGFSRANLFGKDFPSYAREAQEPLVVAQIEHIRALDNLDDILKTPGLDAIMIGPYDLSASMGLTAQFEHPEFRSAIARIRDAAETRHVAPGTHVVDPDPGALAAAIEAGHRFIAYSLDAVFLEKACDASLLVAMQDK